MFVATIILNGGLFCLFVAGILCALSLHIHGFDTPVWSVNAPTAVEVIVSGKGRNRFFVFGQQTIFLNDMTITEKCLNGVGVPQSNRKAQHASQSLYSKFIIEKREKNKAYAFILSRGLLSEYSDFCRTYSGECSTIESRLEIFKRLSHE